MTSVGSIIIPMVCVFLCSPYRRTVPLIHPHSWHLVKLAEEPSVPGSASISDGPLAMQLHPTPFSVPWHSGGDRYGSISMFIYIFCLFITSHTSSDLFEVCCLRPYKVCMALLSLLYRHIGNYTNFLIIIFFY